MGTVILDQGRPVLSLYSKGWDGVPVERPWDEWVSGLSLRADQDTVDHMRGWSILKWGLLATTMALLSVPFLARRQSLPIGVLYLLCALTYTVGLLGHRTGLAGCVEWGFYMMGLAWLLTFVGIGTVPGRSGF